MKKYFFILLLVSAKLFSQTYNPVNGLLTNKPLGVAQAVPTDMRTRFYDSIHHLYRDYRDTTEVSDYLNLEKWRAGNYLIMVHSGGVLNGDGTYTGGTTEAWWYKNGTARSDLVPLANALGGGIMNTITVNNLSPVFTSSVDATDPANPIVNFTLSNAGAYEYLGNNTGAPAPPTYNVPTLARLGDVAFSSLADLQLMRYNAGTGKWNNFTFAETQRWQNTLDVTNGLLLDHDNSVNGQLHMLSFMNNSNMQFGTNSVGGQFQFWNAGDFPWLVFKNDVGETPTPTNGAMISGSWGGGAIKFYNQSAGGGTPSLQLGVIDNSNNFTSFLTMPTGGYGGNWFQRRIEMPFSNKTSNFVMDGTTAHTHTIIYCTSTMTDVTMVDVTSAGIGNGSLYWVKNGKATGTITVSPFAGQTIDGGSSYVLNPGEAVLLSSISSAGWISLNNAAVAPAAADRFGKEDVTAAENRLFDAGSLYKVDITGSKSAPSDYVFGVNNTGSTGRAIYGTSSGGGWGVIGEAATGVGVQGITNSGLAIIAANSSGSNRGAQGIGATIYFGDAMNIERLDTNLTTTIRNSKFFGASTGTVGNGFGQYFDFDLKSNNVGDRLANRLTWLWTDATDATRTSDFIIGGVESAVTKDLLTLHGNGIVKLNQYTSGAFYQNDTTNYKPVVVSATGELYQSSWMGGGGGGGEANTASNLGGGLSNFDSKSGVDLRFNSFASADFDLGSNLITIDATKWLTQSAAAAAYQPLSANLTTYAGIAPSTDVQTMLGSANNAAIRSNIGAGTGNGDALVANPLSQFASTTSAQLATVLSDETGTNKAVFSDNPVFPQHIAVGATGAISSTELVDISETYTDPAVNYGINLKPTNTYTADNISATYGINVAHTIQANSHNLGGFKAFYSEGNLSTAGSIGGYAGYTNHFSNTSTGTVTETDGFIALNPTNSGGGTIQTAIGVSINSHTTASNNTNLLIGSVTTGNWSIYNNSTYDNYFAGNIQIADKNLIFGTGTGTKIGTSTSQKLAFYNSAPIVQPSGNVSTALSNLGLIASPTISYSDISGGTATLGSISNTGTITIPTVTGTLVQKTISTITSNATWSPAGNASVNIYNITAQAAAVTTISAPSGTPLDGNELYIRVVDNGTARAISGWDAIYSAGTNLAFPTTTTLGKYMIIKFIYNTMNAVNKWQLVAVIDGL